MATNDQIVELASKYKPGDALGAMGNGIPADIISRSSETHAHFAAATEDLYRLLPNLVKLPWKEQGAALAAVLAGAYWQGYKRGKAANLVFHVAPEE